MKAMTLGELAAAINAMVAREDWAALAARSVVVRVNANDELHVGGLTDAELCMGCTDTLALVLDASDDAEGSPSDTEDDGR
jgi:hypothetical protein